MARPSPESVPAQSLQASASALALGQWCVRPWRPGLLTLKPLGWRVRGYFACESVRHVLHAHVLRMPGLPEPGSAAAAGGRRVVMMIGRRPLSHACVDVVRSSPRQS